MEEIKIGEYVRNEMGEILKVDKVDDKYIYEKEILSWCHSCAKRLIVKHDKNILKIIKDGDLLNGYPVKEIKGVLCNFDLNVMEWTPLENIDVVETIVTREYLEEIMYRVEE